MSVELRWSEEQAELASLLGSLLAKHSDGLAVRAALGQPGGYDSALWAMLCEQVGVAALAVPGKYDGAGYGFAETAVVLEQLGYALTPSPLLAEVIAADVLVRSGDVAACERLLPALASGESLVTLAWSGPSGLAGVTEPIEESSGQLSGTVELVLYGDVADVLLVAARTADGTGLFEVSAEAVGLTREFTPAMDSTLRLARLSFDAVPATRLGGEVTKALEEVHALAVAAVTALQVGAAQRALDMTVAYSKERVQFGRTIGSFQALKHRMADMLVLVETSRSTSMEAALSVAGNSADMARRSSVAKAWCSDALDKVASEMIQLHGGIAITWEHDSQLVFKRAHALSHLFGVAHRHRATLC